MLKITQQEKQGRQKHLEVIGVVCARDTRIMDKPLSGNGCGEGEVL
jgi:hypothetical protein